jgi:serine/threonine protein kinase
MKPTGPKARMPPGVEKRITRPDAFAQDADRVARFEREAKTLAALSHPNIASTHGLEKTGEASALVMELVEGPTRASRSKRTSRSGSPVTAAGRTLIATSRPSLESLAR